MLGWCHCPSCPGPNASRRRLGSLADVSLTKRRMEEDEERGWSSGGTSMSVPSTSRTTLLASRNELGAVRARGYPASRTGSPATGTWTPANGSARGVARLKAEPTSGVSGLAIAPSLRPRSVAQRCLTRTVAVSCSAARRRPRRPCRRTHLDRAVALGRPSREVSPSPLTGPRRTRPRGGCSSRKAVTPPGASTRQDRYSRSRTARGSSRSRPTTCC
jgi:hypothetical protein